MYKSLLKYSPLSEFSARQQSKSPPVDGVNKPLNKINQLLNVQACFSSKFQLSPIGYEFVNMFILSLIIIVYHL